MSFLECLHRVLSDRNLHTAGPRGSITLREKEVMAVELSGLATDAIAIRLDRLGMSGLDDGPWKKCCDYLIICQAGDTFRAVFVELKKTLSGSDACEQLRRSLPWVKYLWSVCEIESGASAPAPAVRYAVIAEKRNPRFDKQRIKQGRQAETWSYGGIEGTLTIGASSVRLGQLWGR